MVRTSFPIARGFAVAVAVVGVVALASAGRAYDRYSVNRDDTNCR